MLYQNTVTNCEYLAEELGLTAALESAIYLEAVEVLEQELTRGEN